MSKTYTIIMRKKKKRRSFNPLRVRLISLFA